MFSLKYASRRSLSDGGHINLTLFREANDDSSTSILNSTARER